MEHFQFVIMGSPVSQQTRRRDRLRAWQAALKSAAIAAWPATDPPKTGSAMLQISYFYSEPTGALDADNLIKPIQDALISVAYLDDSQVTDIWIKKRQHTDKTLGDWLRIVVSDAPVDELI